MFCLTVDGERGRRLRLAHHVLGHAGVGADISWGQTTDLQGVVLTNLISGVKTGVCVSNVARHSLTQRNMRQLTARTKASRGWNKGRERVRVREGGIVWWKGTSRWVIPSFGKVAVVLPPAHGGNWVATGLTPELYGLVHQHHLAAWSTDETGALCREENSTPN